MLTVAARKAQSSDLYVLSLLRTYIRMGNETQIRLRAKAERIATNPPLSVSVIVSNGAVIPEGNAEAAAEAAAAAVVVGADIAGNDLLAAIFFRSKVEALSCGRYPRYPSTNYIDTRECLFVGGFSLYQDRGFIFQGARRDGVGYGFLEQAGWESSKSEACSREIPLPPYARRQQMRTRRNGRRSGWAYGLLHGMDTRVTIEIICRMK